MKIKTLCAALFMTSMTTLLSAAIAPCSAQAGSVSGTYIVWMNLSKTPATMDAKFRAYINSGKSTCFDSSESIAFMRDKPKEITPELVTKAVVQKDAAAIKTLNAVLKKSFKDEVSSGFDGLVVYTDLPTPAFHSLTTGKRTLQHQELPAETTPEHFDTFYCAIQPPTVRPP